MASPNRYRDGGPEKNPHGKLYEAKVAKKMGARLQPNSGATAGFKGDMKLTKGKNRFLIESKTTLDASISVKLEWLVKITEEARAKAMTPALLFSFVLPNGRPAPNAETEWVAMPLQTFNELTE